MSHNQPLPVKRKRVGIALGVGNDSATDGQRLYSQMNLGVMPQRLKMTEAVHGIRNRFQEVWFLTLPQMKPQLLFGAVMQISSSFAVGAVPEALCGNPSTDYATHTIINHVSDYGGVRYELGYACAISTVLLMVMLIVNKVITKLLVDE